MAKKFLSVLVSVLSVIIILASVGVLFSVVTTQAGKHPSVAGYSMFRVVSGSMEPKIPTDSVVLTKNCSADSIAEGDVISFYSRDPALGGSVNTHRVVKVGEQDGQTVFTTRGDANYMDDEYVVFAEDVVGKVVFVSAIVGKFVRLVSNPMVFGGLVIIPLAIIIFVNLKEMVHTVKEVAALPDEELLGITQGKDESEEKEI